MNQVQNRVDTLGRKQGLWVDTLGSAIESFNYVNNVWNGDYTLVDIESSKPGTVGQYTDGKRTGIWHYFSRKNGSKIYEESEISINDSIEIMNYGDIYRPKYISYIKGYDREFGYLKNEGYILYDESFMEDTSIKKGKWTYYDERNQVIKTEIF